MVDMSYNERRRFQYAGYGKWAVGTLNQAFMGGGEWSLRSARITWILARQGRAI